MNRPNIAVLAALGAASLGLAACSEQTQKDGEAFVEGAAADTAANAEVVQEKVEDAAIVASDKVSEGAADMRDEMAEDEAAEQPRTDHGRELRRSASTDDARLTGFAAELKLLGAHRERRLRRRTNPASSRQHPS